MASPSRPPPAPGPRPPDTARTPARRFVQPKPRSGFCPCQAKPQPPSAALPFPQMLSSSACSLPHSTAVLVRAVDSAVFGKEHKCPPATCCQQSWEASPACSPVMSSRHVSSSTDTLGIPRAVFRARTCYCISDQSPANLSEGSQRGLGLKPCTLSHHPVPASSGLLSR